MRVSDFELAGDGHIKITLQPPWLPNSLRTLVSYVIHDECFKLREIQPESLLFNLVDLKISAFVVVGDDSHEPTRRLITPCHFKRFLVHRQLSPLLSASSTSSISSVFSLYHPHRDPRLHSHHHPYPHLRLYLYLHTVLIYHKSEVEGKDKGFKCQDPIIGSSTVGSSSVASPACLHVQLHLLHFTLILLSISV